MGTAVSFRAIENFPNTSTKVYLKRNIAFTSLQCTYIATLLSKNGFIIFLHNSKAIKFSHEVAKTENEKKNSKRGTRKKEMKKSAIIYFKVRVSL